MGRSRAATCGPPPYIRPRGQAGCSREIGGRRRPSQVSLPGTDEAHHDEVVEEGRQEAGGAERADDLAVRARARAMELEDGHDLDLARVIDADDLRDRGDLSAPVRQPGLLNE